MFKLINRLGVLLVKLYHREAKRLNNEARQESAQSRNMAIRARELADSADRKVHEAASVATKAMQLAKFFE